MIREDAKVSISWEVVAKSRDFKVRQVLVPSQILSPVSSAKLDNIGNSFKAVSSSINEENKLNMLL